jgi:Uma2 family endonuclease
MTTILNENVLSPALPDHTQLPDRDGKIVINFQEPPQVRLLVDSLEPTLRERHPDGNYCVGRDCGIYYRYTEPLLEGCKAPDWFYIPDVPALVNGQVRRSYVLWQEPVAPLIVIECVSGDGSEERDRTPQTGKFWVYERAIRVPYYAIYEVDPGRVEVYQLVHGQYQPLPANERGHYPIEPLGVELGIWQGQFENLVLPWLRWWDAEGNLLPTGAERAEQEHRRAEQEHRRAEQERQQKEEAQRQLQRLAERLRSLGVDPEAP